MDSDLFTFVSLKLPVVIQCMFIDESLIANGALPFLWIKQWLAYSPLEAF